MKTIDINNIGISSTKTFTTNATDIYKSLTKILTAPDGYEFTGEFRPVKAGDIFLTTDYRAQLSQKQFNNDPRLILQREEKENNNSTKAQPKSFIMKYLGYRIPKIGEWYASNNDIAYRAVTFVNNTSKLEVYERVEI